ncbi:MAG: SET domain-containing protein-lysine N-methyltransferase [Verrucomicrobiota bacterium]
MAEVDSIQAVEPDGVICETELIQFRRSRIHGTGGYARTNIAKGTPTIEYVGRRITKAESNIQCEGDNVYIFTLDDECDLDGNVDWNPARFINHSCAPNCEAEWDEDRLWIITIRDIQPGEELTFNYGYDLEDYREHPCLCGTPECVGFIVAEEHFEHVRKQADVRKLAAG